MGGAATIPFGKNAPLSPPGSCPANPGGPISDGQQLADIVSSSGASSSPASGSSSPSNSSAAAAPVSSAASSPTPAAAPPVASASSFSAAGAAVSSPNGFQLQNGKDAQALNAKFESLTADSSCTGTCLAAHQFCRHLADVSDSE